MTSLAKLTKENAPRNHTELAKIGRFQLRQLADELGLFTSEDVKMAYQVLDTKDQAQQVLDALNALDKGGGGAPPADAPTTKTKRQPKTSEDAPPAGGGGGSDPRVGQVLEVLEAQGKVLTNISVQLEGLRALVATSASLTLLVGEQALGAGRQEILAAALDDIGVVLKQVGDSMGKAKK